MAIMIKTPQEIEKMRISGKALRRVHDAIAPHVVPGASTMDLEEIAVKKIAELGAIAAFKGYHGFPAALCTSVNHEVVHGMPNAKRILVEGDILSIDCGVIPATGTSETSGSEIIPSGLTTATSVNCGSSQTVMCSTSPTPILYEEPISEAAFKAGATAFFESTNGLSGGVPCAKHTAHPIKKRVAVAPWGTRQKIRSRIENLFHQKLWENPIRDGVLSTGRRFSKPRLACHNQAVNICLISS